MHPSPQSDKMSPKKYAWILRCDIQNCDSKIRYFRVYYLKMVSKKWKTNFQRPTFQHDLSNFQVESLTLAVLSH